MSTEAPVILKAQAPARLERLCRAAGQDWVRPVTASHGIERLEAWFSGHAYERHRHETYAIGLTQEGVQSFHYRGGLNRSLPGQVLVLHPDEVHDGRAGTEVGFGYRMLYVEPALITRVLDDMVGGGAVLPFAREAVADDPWLARVVAQAFDTEDSGVEELAADDVVVRLAEGLLRRAGGGRRKMSVLAVGAVQNVRMLLDEESDRTVTSAELEQVSGLDRFALNRHFRARYGTSPHRYLVGRRLRRAQALLGVGVSVAQVAAECGFADQSHLTRQFKERFGWTPGQYVRLFRSVRWMIQP